MELPEMRHAQFRQILRRVRNPKAGGRLDLQLRYGQLRKVLQRVRQPAPGERVLGLQLRYPEHRKILQRVRKAQAITDTGGQFDHGDNYL